MSEEVFGSFEAVDIAFVEDDTQEGEVIFEWVDPFPFAEDFELTFEESFC